MSTILSSIRGHAKDPGTERTLRDRLDNTEAVNRIVNNTTDRTGFDPERFTPTNGPDPTRQRGLVYRLLAQLDKHNPEAGRTGRAWFEANDADMTVAQRSGWINRIRAKLAEPAAPAPVAVCGPYCQAETVGEWKRHTCGFSMPDPAPYPVDVKGDCRSCRFIGDPQCAVCHPATPARPATNAWREFRDVAAQLIRTGGSTGIRFVVDNDPGAGNDVSFWWLTSNDRTGRYTLRQVIGGQGDDGPSFQRIRMSPEAQTTVMRRAIDAGAYEAMLRYGRLIGACGHCGRTLTNQESRDAGIGPVCITKDHG